MCILKALIKSSSYDCWTAEYLVCQIPIKMLKLHAIPNSSLHNLKIYSSRGCRKTSQRCRWIRYLANTTILNIRIFSRRYHLRLLALLRLVNNFTFDSGEYYTMCYKVNMPRPLKTLYIYYFTLWPHKSSYVSIVYCRLARLTNLGLWNYIDLGLCIIGSH